MMREADMHNAFSAWLRKHKLPFLHCRTDKRATVDSGMPDYAIFRDGRVTFCEFKMPKTGKISPIQTQKFDELAAAGCTVRIATSLEQAIAHVEAEFYKGGDVPCLENSPLQSNGAGQFKPATCAEPAPSPKQYLANVRHMGQVVVDGQGQFYRRATEHDRATLPLLPSW